MKTDPLAHIPQPAQPIPGMRLFLKIVAIVCPVVWIVFATFKAVYSGYSAAHLTDPGHKRIWVYDGLIILASITLTFVAFTYTYDFDLAQFRLAATQEDFMKAALALQFSGWESFILIYILSFLLYFYDTRRERIIGDINRHFKVW